MLGAAAPPPASVTVAITGLRSAKGQILACLTSRADAFPDCGKDPLARKLKVSLVPETNRRAEIVFVAVPPGRYAVSLVHDENGNGKLDTSLMIPREGYGFSLDAPVHMAPPKFERAAFMVEGADVHLAIKMRYLF